MPVPLARAAAAALWVAVAAVLSLALPAAASAAPEYTLTVNVSGEGSVGCRVRAPEEEFEECASTAKYPAGTKLSLTVNPTPSEAEENFGAYEEEFGAYEYREFAHWGGTCASRGSNLTCPIEMTEDETVEAVFVGEPMPFALGTAGSGGGKVECEVYGSGVRETKCASKYRYETELVLYASPNAESEFVEWEGCWVESEAECEVTIEEDSSVTATFALEPLLSIALEGSGKSGSWVECEYEGVLEAECRKRYPSEAEVMLYAEAGPETEFVGWAGAGCEGAEEACEVQMAGPQSVTATFALEPEAEGEEEEPGEEEPPSEEEAGNEETPGGGGGSGGGGTGGGGSSGGGSQSPGGGVASTGGSTPSSAPSPRGAVAVARQASVRGSMAALRLRCAGAAACAGTLELEAKLPARASSGGRRRRAASFVRIGGARFSLSPGGSASVRLRVRRAAVRYLARRGRLAASVAGTGVTPSAIVLKAAKRTIKHR